MTEMPPPDEVVNCNITELLTEIYQRLERSRSVKYRLSAEGKNLWKNWHVWCERNKSREPNGALQAIYPKAKERAARIALVLHCLDAAINNHPPAEIVSTSILNAAIELMRWGIEQTLLLYAEMGAADHEDSSKIARFILHFAGREVGARDVSRWYPAKRQIKAEQAREFMRLVESLSFATGNFRIGSKYRIKVDYSIVPDKSYETSSYEDFKPDDKSHDANMTTNDIGEVDYEPLPINVRGGQETVRNVARTLKP
jgi:hypothetical protein